MRRRLIGLDTDTARIVTQVPARTSAVTTTAPTIVNLHGESAMSAMTREETEALIQEVLEVYPEKAKQGPRQAPGPERPELEQSKQVRHVQPQVPARRDDDPRLRLRRVQGRGVGPDQGHDPHLPRPGRLRPVLLGHGRRNYYIGTTGVNTFGTMNFTSDFQEKDIVYGGDKKLAKLIDEIEEPVPARQGDLGPVRMPGRPDRRRHRRGRQEDVEGNRQADHPVRCEGFRGVSQSLGHHIANDTIRDYIIETRESARRLRAVALRRRPHRRLQHRRRRLVVAHPAGRDGPARRWPSGPATARWPSSRTRPRSSSTCIHCYRSMNYICRHMEEKYGIPWIEFNFFGPTKIAESLRKIAELFDDTIKEGAERVIAKYEPEMRGGHRQVPAAAGRQEGHALRRRPAAPPRHRRLRGPGHGGRRHRLRVRPQRRLRPHASRRCPTPP